MVRMVASDSAPQDALTLGAMYSALLNSRPMGKQHVLHGQCIKFNAKPQAPAMYLEDWGKQGPGGIQFVIANEEAFVAVDDIKDKALVSIRQVHVVSLLVGEVQLCDIQMQAQTWHLVVNFEINSLIWLDAHHLDIPNNSR